MPPRDRCGARDGLPFLSGEVALPRKTSTSAEDRREHGLRLLQCHTESIPDLSSTPNRLFIYEIDSFAHFDALNRDPDFRGVKLDSLYSSATGTTWGEVTL